MTKKLLVSLIILSGLFNAQSDCLGAVPHTEEQPEMLTPEHDVVSNFENYYQDNVQEKLFIRTDKPYYCAGETIWFKGWLVNSLINTPEQDTKYIYIELTNSSGELIERLKVKADEHSRFHNAMELRSELPPGEYNLRAYSRWMMNFDHSNFFSKTIQIDNPVDNRVNMDVSYVDREDGKVYMQVRFTDSNNKPFARKRIQTSLYTEGLNAKTLNYTTNDNGELEIPFEAGSEQAAQSVEFNIKESHIDVSRVIELPSFSDDFDIQFLPEGGRLIPGYAQNVAFKAIGKDGLSVDVEGKVYADGQLEGDFQSTHKGMGIVRLAPEKDTKYTFEVISKSGITKTVELLPSQSGCTLQTQVDDDTFMCRLITTPEIDPSKLSLVVMSRGILIHTEPFSESSMSKVFPKDILWAGIAQMLIVERETKEVVASRMMYMRDENPLQVSFQANTGAFKPRQLVSADIEVADADGQAVEGDFVLSVTDGSIVHQDISAENLRTYLELSSNLEGHIEQPAMYFDPSDEKAAEKLDMLMLTQGWRLYDMPSAIKGEESTRNKIRKETDITVSGKVEGLFGGIKNRELMFFDEEKGISQIIPLENTSEFTLRGIDVHDTTKAVIMAMNKKGGSSGIVLKPYYNELPNPEFRPMIKNYKDNLVVIPPEYSTQSVARYYYEGGMRVFEFSDIVVTQKRQAREKTPSYTPTRSFNSEDVTKYSKAGMPLRSLLSVMPGISYRGSQFYLRGGGPAAAIFLDGVALRDEMWLDMVYSDEIAYLDLVSDASAVSFAGSVDVSGGVIAIETKGQLGINPRNFAPMMALMRLDVVGYRLPKQFYQPKYDVPEELKSKTPDLRSTIAWMPEVSTDADGKAHVSFYTADKETPYDILVEGLSKDGRPVTFTTRLFE